MKTQLTPSFKATVLYQNAKYSIEKYFNKNTNKYSLVVIINKTIADFVMVYDSPFIPAMPIVIAFDNPYNISEAIKAKCRKIAQTLN